MANHPTPSASRVAVVHLLDAAQGHTLQTWRFDNQDQIKIGRSDDNDIALADPHVSRAHAKLIFDKGAWKLVSTGRHGTLINDRLISEATIGHRTVFRLGAAGPTLRFDTCALETRRSETIEGFDGDLLSMLEIDEQRKQHEVEQIAANDMFRELQEHARRVRSTGTDQTEVS